MGGWHILLYLIKKKYTQTFNQTFTFEELKNIVNFYNMQYILNFANVYPYDGASSSTAIDPAYNSLSYVSLKAGYRGTMSFKMDMSRPFMSGAHVVFGIMYDGCEYFVSAYEDGSAYYI